VHAAHKRKICQLTAMLSRGISTKPFEFGSANAVGPPRAAPVSRPPACWAHHIRVGLHVLHSLQHQKPQGKQQQHWTLTFVAVNTEQQIRVGLHVLHSLPGSTQHLSSWHRPRRLSSNELLTSSGLTSCNAVPYHVKCNCCIVQHPTVVAYN
jgi:hypothetical protein